MKAIHNRILTEEQMRPIAVQIDYADWLEIERALSLPAGTPLSDLEPFRGTIELPEDPVVFQRRIREEW